MPYRNTHKLLYNDAYNQAFSCFTTDSNLNLGTINHAEVCSFYADVQVSIVRYCISAELICLLGLASIFAAS